MKLAAINQNWLCGHNLYNALLQGYRAGGRITALGIINHAVNNPAKARQLVFSPW
jgi:hypothetical protein